MAGDESGQKTSFKVQDRRRFSSSGDARDDVEERSETSAPGDPAPPAPPVEAEASAPPGAEAGQPPPPGTEITFASFVFSLSTQALVHLGEIPDPVDGATHVHLDGAQQIIDILAVLSDKTRGNLDPAENALLENALYDLRMRYVDRTRRR
jgi:hypothetical protein